MGKRTLQEECESLHAAVMECFLEVCKAVGLIKFMDFLECKLKKEK